MDLSLITKNAKKRTMSGLIFIGTKTKNIMKRAKGMAFRLALFIKVIPGWLKSRPSAVKSWVKENRKKRKYHTFKLEKRLKPDYRNIPTSWSLSKQSFKLFLDNFWIFFAFISVHVAVYGLLVYGPTNFNVKDVQESIKTFFGGDGKSAASTFALLGSVITAQTQRDGASVYNFLIFLSISLAEIWAIRRIITKQSFKIRDAFYSGMAPVIPVIGILLVMTVQLIPFTVASYIYTVGRTNGVFISGLEDLSFFMIALSCGLLSFYLITPSLLSIYAVTLPNMYPINTIRLTKKIVQYRRFLVFRRVVTLPFIVAALFFLILLLLLRFYPQSGIWFVQAFPIIILPLIHIYLFKLYKSLI